MVIILFAGSAYADDSVTGNEIAALINRLGVDAADDKITRRQLRRLLAQRKNSLSANAADTLQRDELEEEVWAGVVERVWVDHIDTQGDFKPGPTQFYLRSGARRLQIFFMDEADAHAASGKRWEIRGYRSGRKALVLDAVRQQRGATRTDQDQVNRNRNRNRIP